MIREDTETAQETVTPLAEADTAVCPALAAVMTAPKLSASRERMEGS
jgi:hypothetical protein